MFYSISFLRGSLVGFAVAFILAVVLFNPDGRITLGVSVLCALYGGFAANRTARIKHDRVGEEWQWENAKIEKLHRLRERHLDPFRSELAPGEDVIKYATRESRVRLLGPAGCFLVGMLLVFAGMKVGSIEPSTWKIPEIKIFEETEDSKGTTRRKQEQQGRQGKTAGQDKSEAGKEEVFSA